MQRGVTESSNEINGGIAQLGEHLLCKQGVNGSIPFISTRVFPKKREKRKAKGKLAAKTNMGL